MPSRSCESATSEGHNRFLRELDRLHGLRGSTLDLEAFYTAVELLAAGKHLPETFCDHGLHTDWLGYREFHVGDDDLVIYQHRLDEIVFRRAGTHKQLFRRRY